MTDSELDETIYIGVVANHLTGRREYWIELALRYVGQAEPETALFMIGHNPLHESELSAHRIGYSAQALIDGLAQARMVESVSAHASRRPNLGPVATADEVAYLEIELPVETR